MAINMPLATGRFCDFCNDPTPRWDYPCNTFNVWGLVNSIDSWLSCDHCRLLIQGEQWEQLAARAATSQGWPIWLVRQIHDEFRKHKKPGAPAAFGRA